METGLGEAWDCASWGIVSEDPPLGLEVGKLIEEVFTEITALICAHTGLMFSFVCLEDSEYCLSMFSIPPNIFFCNSSFQ